MSGMLAYLKICTILLQPTYTYILDNFVSRYQKSLAGDFVVSNITVILISCILYELNFLVSRSKIEHIIILSVYHILRSFYLLILYSYKKVFFCNKTRLTPCRALKLNIDICYASFLIDSMLSYKVYHHSTIWHN